MEKTDGAPSRLMTLDEVSAFLNISKTTVYRLVDNRAIPFYRLGRSLRFSEGDLTKYLATQRVAPMHERIARS